MDSTDYAFKLAETYRDFHALSELSHHASADEVITTPDRIRGYIERFRGEFTTQLYNWYIEQGRLAVDSRVLPRLTNVNRQTQVIV